eukprot:6397853-Lingulodinium_polyedra.AAC.1
METTPAHFRRTRRVLGGAAAVLCAAATTCCSFLQRATFEPPYVSAPRHEPWRLRRLTSALSGTPQHRGG